MRRSVGGSIYGWVDLWVGWSVGGLVGGLACGSVGGWVIRPVGPSVCRLAGGRRLVSPLVGWLVGGSLSCVFFLNIYYFMLKFIVTFSYFIK